MTNIILTAAVKGTIVLAAAWIATILLRRKSADLRHRVWSAAMVALALLMIPWPAPAPASFVASAEIGAGKAAAAATRSFPMLPLLWLAGVAVLLIRFGSGMLRLMRLTRSARIAAGDGTRVSESIRTPMTWGAIRPVILLPAYTRTWTDEDRELVLRHERAHIARRDWVWHLFAQLMTALFWFHPLVWFAAARMRQEAEHAADDATLAGGVAAADYAERLMEVARQMRGTAPDLAMAMVRRPALSARIGAILDSGRVRSGAGLRARAGIVLAAGALLLPLSAFQNRTVYHTGEDGVKAPSVVSRVNPSYTDEAKTAKIQGTVGISAVVNAQGHAEEIQVTKSLDPGLDASAVGAISQWVFNPGTKDGQPVDVAVMIEVNFKLQ